MKRVSYVSQVSPNPPKMSFRRPKGGRRVVEDSVRKISKTLTWVYPRSFASLWMTFMRIQKGNTCSSPSVTIPFRLCDISSTEYR